MTNPIGPLTAADEGFNHQIIDTFATVGTSDLPWTEMGLDATSSFL